MITKRDADADEKISAFSATTDLYVIIRIRSEHLGDFKLVIGSQQGAGIAQITNCCWQCWKKEVDFISAQKMYL